MDQSYLKKDSDVFPLSSLTNSLYIPPDDALNRWDAWLASQGSRERYNYDIAILWTGYDLGTSSSDSSTAGYAWVGTVCDVTQNTGVVEYDGTYTTVTHTAHEIAHVLGASHDGGATDYVMAPTAYSDSTLRWWFSLCSTSDVWGVIGGLSENCMLSTNLESTIPNSAITPNLATPDVLCARDQGSDYYFSHYKGFYGDSVPHGDQVCSRLYCCTTESSTCYTVMSSDGMVCGQAKTCKEGSCQTDAESAGAAAVTNENCLFGDQKIVGGDQVSCADYTSRYALSVLCNTGWFRERCCLTCADYLRKRSAGKNMFTLEEVQDMLGLSDEGERKLTKEEDETKKVQLNKTHHALS